VPREHAMRLPISPGESSGPSAHQQARTPVSASRRLIP
jgi:hypothetical protein